MDLSSAIPALMLGVLGAGHCLGMCGGIMSALAMGSTHNSSGFSFAYNLGRITSYTVMGAIVGGVVGLAPTGGLPIARTLAGVVLILMGLYAAGWWNIITLLERAGGRIWHVVKPLSGRFIPIKHLSGAYVVGLVWGWLPCGLVYTALAYSAAQNTLVGGAFVMVLFGAGTLPALLFGGVALGRIRQWLILPWIKYLLGFAYIGFGLWTIIIAWMHAGHHNHAAHSSSQHQVHDKPLTSPLPANPHHHH